MDRNSFSIGHVDSLDAMWNDEQEFLFTMSSKTARQAIACGNWEKDFPSGHTGPHAMARMAYSATHLYVCWHMRSNGLRALHATDLSPVAQEHCVEFFVQLPGEKTYWNFEVNALGTLNASHRVERPCPTRLTGEQLRAVRRHGSHVGLRPFEIKEEPTAWWVAIAIPWSLIGVTAGELPRYLRGNLYACAGGIDHPYYLSRFPITTPRPDFHRPDFFGTIHLLPS